MARLRGVAPGCMQAWTGGAARWLLTPQSALFTTSRLRAGMGAGLFVCVREFEFWQGRPWCAGRTAWTKFSERCRFAHNWCALQ